MGREFIATTPLQNSADQTSGMILGLVPVLITDNR